jgi:HSP20 family protein
MPETELKSPAKREESALHSWRPFESLRREVERLFDDLEQPFRGSLLEPFWRPELSWAAAPAVDIVEQDNAYEIAAELPGMDEKNVEVKLANGGLIIKGRKEEEQEEKKKDYYVHERHFGAFERSFRLPDNVDTTKIDASFKKGVLRVTLPKKKEAQKPERKIEVKAV